MSFLPAMTGNGLYIPPYTTYKNGTGGGWCKWPCFTHISDFQMPPAKLNVICLDYTGEPGKNKATEHH